MAPTPKLCLPLADTLESMNALLFDPSDSAVGTAGLPLWQGEPLAGRTLLIDATGDVEDALFFARYFGVLLAQAGRVMVRCDASVASLLARSFPAATVVGAEDVESLEAVDCRIVAEDLPLYMQVGTEAATGYLTPDPVRVAHWRERLAEDGDGLKVGFLWRGASGGEGFPAVLESWMPIFVVPGVRWVSLEAGDVQQELREIQERFGVALVDGGREWPEEWEEQAALYGALDIVLAPAMAGSWLAQAVGTPVWVVGDAQRDWTDLGSLAAEPERVAGEDGLITTFRALRPQEAVGVEPSLAMRNLAVAAAALSPSQVVDIARMVFDDVCSIQLTGWPLEWLRQTVEVLDRFEDRLASQGAAWLIDLALAHGRVGDFAGAQGLIERAYALDDGLRDGFARLGWIKCEVWDWRGVVEIVRRDIELERVSPPWRVILALAEARCGHWQTAETLIAQAYQENAALTDWFTDLGWLGYISDKGASYLQRLADRDTTQGRSIIDGQRGKVMNLIASGKEKEAIQGVEDIYATFPKTRELSHLFSLIASRLYVNRGAYTQGLELLARDFTNDRMIVDGWKAFYAVLLASDGSLDEALDIIDTQLAIKMAHSLVLIPTYHHLNTVVIIERGELREFLVRGGHYADLLERYSVTATASKYPPAEPGDIYSP